MFNRFLFWQLKRYMNHITVLLLNSYLIRPIREKKEASPPPVPPGAHHWPLRSCSTWSVTLPNTAKKRKLLSLRRLGRKNAMHCTLPTSLLSAEQLVVSCYFFCTVWADIIEGSTQKERDLFLQLSEICSSHAVKTEPNGLACKWCCFEGDSVSPPPTAWRCQALQHLTPISQAGCSLTR